jgi:HEAT repeat protein
MAPKAKGKDGAGGSKAPAFVSPFDAHCNAAAAANKALKKLCKGGPAKLEINAPAIIQNFTNHNLHVVVEQPAQKFRCPMDRDIRKAAVAALGKLPVAALVSNAEALISKLDDPEDVVRTAAVTVLAGPKSPPSLPDALLPHGQAIAAHLANPDKGVRDAALAVWSRLPLCGDKFGLLKCAEEVVVPLLEHASGGVREAAMCAIRKLDAASRSQMAAAIVKRLEDADGDVRTAASMALLDLSPDVLQPYASSVLEKLGTEDGIDDKAIAERVRLLHLQNPLLFKVATEPPPSPPRARQPKAQDAGDD